MTRKGCWPFQNTELRAHRGKSLSLQSRCSLFHELRK